MNYKFVLNNTTIAQIHSSNSYSALQFFKSLPKFRQLTLAEQCAVKIQRAS